MIDQHQVPPIIRNLLDRLPQHPQDLRILEMIHNIHHHRDQSPRQRREVIHRRRWVLAIQDDRRVGEQTIPHPAGHRPDQHLQTPVQCRIPHHIHRLRLFQREDRDAAMLGIKELGQAFGVGHCGLVYL